MIAFVRKTALRFLKVPPEPTPPAGSESSLRIFRAARNFYRMLLLKWGLKQLSVIVGAIISLYYLGQWSQNWNPRVVFWINIAEWFGIASVIAQMPFTLALVRFDYELRWYMVTDRSLRIRTGIWDIREMTMTFANIQQITVEQGPLQRLLGLEDVMVRTAGGGSGGAEQGHQKGQHEMMHLGFFHGVNNAPEIRDMILDRMRRLRDSGLGDPDDEESAPDEEASPGGHDAKTMLVESVVEFSRETVELRRAISMS